MDWSDFFPFLLLAITIAIMLIRKQFKKEKKLTPDGILPSFSRLIPHTDENWFTTFPELLEPMGYHLFEQNRSLNRLIIEDPRIGPFHWGFYFIIEPYQEQPTQLQVGIFPKGVNPPKGKRLMQHLDDFIGKLQHP